MKIALITDTHWGIRNDSLVMLDNMKRFLDDIFFPYLDDNNVRTVVHLGDLVDRRKYLNHYTMHRLMNDFLIPMYNRDIQCHFIAGNHDTYFKNTNEINAIENITGDRFEDFFTSYQRFPREFDFDGTKVLMLPWICDENRNACLDKIQNTSAQIVMGHLELYGYEMYRGHKSDHGDDPKLFDRFDCVFTGHFHTKSHSGNIYYLGSPSQYTWSDYGDERGFHIFDTETRELTFIRNPYSVFRKIHYNDAEKSIEEVVNFDANEYAGCFVKVIVQNKTNPYWFDMVIDKLEKIGISNLQVVEDHLNLNLVADEEIVNEAEDTMTILRKYVDGMTVNDKKRVDNIVTELYNEALSIQ